MQFLGQSDEIMLLGAQYFAVRIATGNASEQNTMSSNGLEY
jgi:hypothetical protein